MDSATQSYCPPDKESVALCMMRQAPEKWFRHLQVDNRDRALLDAARVPFVDYDKPSFLRKMYTLKQGEELFEHIAWDVDGDENCKKIVAEAGGTLVGFPLEPAVASKWKSIEVVVHINAPPTVDLGCTWGLLGTQPTKTRIFKGPKDTCENHPWDAMILRDCRVHTDGFMSVDSISSRMWDILLMKMCEDYDYPWVVVAVKDSGLDTNSPTQPFSL